MTTPWCAPKYIANFQLDSANFWPMCSQHWAELVPSFVCFDNQVQDRWGSWCKLAVGSYVVYNPKVGAWLANFFQIETINQEMADWRAGAQQTGYFFWIQGVCLEKQGEFQKAPFLPPFFPHSSPLFPLQALSRLLPLFTSPFIPPTSLFPKNSDLGTHMI